MMRPPGRTCRTKNSQPRNPPLSFDTLVLNMPIPLEAPWRDPLMNPETVLLHHGRQFHCRFQGQTSFVFFHFQTHASTKSEPVPQRFRHHDPSGVINGERHTINNGTWLFLWQAALNFPIFQEPFLHLHNPANHLLT